VVFILWCSSSLVLAQSSDTGRIEVRFIGDTSLEGLSRGESGEGSLLYMRPGADSDRPALVVRLSRQPGADLAVAEVFDAPPGQNYVPINIRGDRLILDPSLTPTIAIKALGGWWTRDGMVNYNLDIQVNGPIYAMWGGGYDVKTGPSSWTALIKPGEPAVNIKVRDPNQEGIPKSDLRSLLPAFPGHGYYRTNYAERKCSSPLNIDRGVAPPWPYVAQVGEFEQPVGKLQPPIVVDWEKGRITYFSELVTVRNQNCSYSLYSLNSLTPGTVNQPNFETPFAFYDLSGQGNGRPNLILRTERYPAGDPWFTNTHDFQTIRYSWRETVGDWRWDYKIEVLGSHPYTFQTSIAGGDIVIDAPDYESFPRWVIERNWPVVTFIDTEDTNYRSSEGIYDWFPREIGEGYVFGQDERVDPKAFSAITAHLRGEYRYTQNIRPGLYFSSLDNRLHLIGAEGGVWSLGEERVLRMHNVDGGSYINGWTREHIAGEVAPSDERIQTDTNTVLNVNVPGTVEESLHALDGYLIYSGPMGAELRQAQYQYSSFEVFPPTDKASWQSFRDQLAPYAAQKRDPSDLKSWLNSFPGKTLAIAGGQISDVRATSDGFRFVVDLQPGFQAQASDLLDLRRLQPGRYVVTYNGHFSAEPLTPPIFSASIPSTTLTQLELGTVQVALRNNGLQDVPETTLELWAVPPQGQATLVATRTITLLSQTPIMSTVQWAPSSAGQWTLTPKLRQPNGQLITFNSAQAMVLPAQAADAEAVGAASTSAGTLSFSIVGLIAFALIAALVFWGQWRTLPPGQVDDAN
jgi:hypothetical protein